MINTVKSVIVFAMVILLIIYPGAVIDAATDSLDTCINILFPSLFPFFVLSKIFIKSGGAVLVGRFFNPVMNLFFKISGNGASSLVLGVLCGYPIGAKTAADLYRQSAITKNEAENLMCFCNNSGPLFIIGAVGVGMFSSKSAGIFLYAVHILSALTLGFILRFTLPKNIKDTSIKKTYYTGGNDIFTSSVEESILSILNVFAYVIFFSVIINIFNSVNLFGFLTNLFGFFNVSTHVSTSIIYSILEMTAGIKKLSDRSLPLSLQLILTSFILGWSGLSIYFQTKSVVMDFRFSNFKYIFAKLTQGIIASIYTVIFLKILPIDQTVFFNSSHRFTDIRHIPIHHFIGTASITIIYFILLLRSSDNRRC